MLRHVGEGEGPHIRKFFDQLGRWLACAMPGAGFNPDQDRILPILGSLEGRGKFKTVRGEDPVVVVPRQDHGRGIRHSFLDIMVG